MSIGHKLWYGMKGHAARNAYVYKIHTTTCYGTMTEVKVFNKKVKRQDQGHLSWYHIKVIATRKVEQGTIFRQRNQISPQFSVMIYQCSKANFGHFVGALSTKPENNVLEIFDKTLSTKPENNVLEIFDKTYLNSDKRKKFLSAKNTEITGD